MTLTPLGDEARYLVELRMQRSLLAGVGAEIAASQRGLTVHADGRWRSPAQREFASAVDGVSELLRTAWHALDAAVAEIDSEVASLAAASSVAASSVTSGSTGAR